MVSTLDSESKDPSSNLGGTLIIAEIVLRAKPPGILRPADHHL